MYIKAPMARATAPRQITHRVTRVRVESFMVYCVYCWRSSRPPSHPDLMLCFDLKNRLVESSAFPSSCFWHAVLTTLAESCAASRTQIIWNRTDSTSLQESHDSPVVGLVNIFNELLLGECSPGQGAKPCYLVASLAATFSFAFNLSHSLIEKHLLFAWQMG